MAYEGMEWKSRHSVVCSGSKLKVREMCVRRQGVGKVSRVVEGAADVVVWCEGCCVWWKVRCAGNSQMGVVSGQNGMR